VFKLPIKLIERFIEILNIEEMSLLDIRGSKNINTIFLLGLIQDGQNRYYIYLIDVVNILLVLRSEVYCSNNILKIDSFDSYGIVLEASNETFIGNYGWQDMGYYCAPYILEERFNWSGALLYEYETYITKLYSNYVLKSYYYHILFHLNSDLFYEELILEYICDNPSSNISLIHRLYLELYQEIQEQQNNYPKEFIEGI
jgi:hypothetical protein